MEAEVAPAKRMGRPPKAMGTSETVPQPMFDPEDKQAAEIHRQMVRAASANANKTPQFTAQHEDLLSQQARQNAVAQKSHYTNPVNKETTQSAPKIMSHAQLKAKMAAEEAPK
jgi:hypothetical protein